MARDDGLAEFEDQDLSQWISTPSSSRVSRIRYDHANKAVQVQWTNNIGNGYVYGDMSYEEYRSFARAASKGRRINDYLNNKPYRPMEVDEYSQPSNTSRKGLASRVKT